MATRTISTKLAIDGESEYRASLSRINGEIKTLNSGLRLTESEFKTNANSMAALTAKSEALSKLYTAQASKVKELERAMESARKSESLYASVKQEIEAQIEANTQALDKLKRSAGDTTAEQERLTAENKELNAELERNAPYLEAAQRGVSSWQDKLNTAKVQLNELNAQITLNDEYLKEARTSTDGCATSIDRFGDRTEAASQRADELTSALAAAGLIAALRATAEALKACAEESITFESAMAGVAKTTDMTGPELEAMGAAIKELATRIPATAAEIASVAEAAGQLGIAKDNILAFSEVMVNLGVATNLSAEEAATSLAKFANVVGMAPENYERLGSTIVALGNSAATTEADIVSMATRLASAGSIVGLSEAEIMAVATALSSVGIEAEAGGSAISKLLKQFEVMVSTGAPELTGFAEVAGMTAEEFSAAWGDNAVAALSQFIDGLGKVDAAGGSTVAVLQNLGLTETRLSNAVQALSTSNGILAKSVNTANNAWAQNTALSKEAETRYATTESKLQLLANAADNAKIAIGDDLTPAIGDMAESAARACNNLADFINENTSVVPVVASTAASLATMAIGITGIATASKVAAAAVKLFNLATAASPVGVAVTAVAALTAGLATLAMTTRNDAVPSVQELTAAADALNQTMEDAEAIRKDTVNSTLAASNVAEHYIDKLKALEAAGLKTDQQSREYHNTLALLCQVVPELSSLIDLETDTIEGGTAALEANTEAWRKNATVRAYQDQLTAATEAHAAALVEAEKNSIGYTDAMDRQQRAANGRADAETRMAVLLDQAKAKARAVSEATGGTADATAFLAEEYYTLQKSLYDYDVEMQNASASADAYKAAMEADAEAVAAAENEMQQTQKAVDNLTKSMEENTDAAGDNAGALDDSAAGMAGMEEEAKALAEAYNAVYDAALTSINGQIGLFDSFAATVSADMGTVEKMMQRWEEQAANLETYTSNLKKAVQYGIDEGLVASLSDGSAESAGYLATIIAEVERLGGSVAGMSSEAADFVTEFNAAFQATDEAKESFADTVAGIETKMSVLPGHAAQVGEETLNGMIAGMENREGALYQKVAQIVETAIETARITGQIASPSKRTTRMFEFVGDGMVLGLENRRQKLKDTMQSIVEESLHLDPKGRINAAMAQIDTTMPAVTTAISRQTVTTHSTSVQHHYGSVTIHVYQRQGEGDTDFAYHLMDIMQAEKDRKESAL